ncbi:MAG: 50S ribosomal protein L20 [Planctomycetes bacterium DG_23]|nr:MAG: 50S ribosomal protein L20 [Planctomycetes bacterium DG_23]
MARARKGAARRQAKKKLFKAAKGYRGGRHRLYRTVKEAVTRAKVYAYRDRKRKKRDFRRLWITRINAACRARGITYSEFVHGLNQAQVDINRKMLAEMAVSDEASFDKLVEMAKEKLKISA